MKTMLKGTFALVLACCVRERVIAQGSAEIVGGTPEQFGAFVAEIVKWARIVKESGAKAD